MNGIQLYCSTTKTWMEGNKGEWGQWSSPQVNNIILLLDVILLNYQGQGGNSQNFLRRILKIFVTLGLKNLTLLSFVLITLKIIKYLLSMNNYLIKASQCYKNFTKLCLENL